MPALKMGVESPAFFPNLRIVSWDPISSSQWFSVSLSHKLAAWLERGLLRDLYDVHFIHEVLGVGPDIPTLKDRLTDIHYQRKGARGPKTMSLPQFAQALLEQAATLTPRGIERELQDVIDKDELPGLDFKIRKVLKGIAEACNAGSLDRRIV